MRDILSANEVKEIGAYIKEHPNQTLIEVWDGLKKKSLYKGLTKELLKRIMDGTYMSSMTGITKKNKPVNEAAIQSGFSNIADVAYKPLAIETIPIIDTKEEKEKVSNNTDKANKSNDNSNDIKNRLNKNYIKEIITMATFKKEYVEAALLAAIKNGRRTDNEKLNLHYYKILHYEGDSANFSDFGKARDGRNTIIRLLSVNPRSPYADVVAKYLYLDENGELAATDDANEHLDEMMKKYPDLMEFALKEIEGVKPIEAATTDTSDTKSTNDTQSTDTTNDNTNDKIESIKKEYSAFDNMSFAQLIETAVVTSLKTMSIADMLAEFPAISENTTIGELSNILKNDMIDKPIGTIRNIIKGTNNK